MKYIRVILKQDGSFYPYLNEGDLSKVPIVYTKVGVARHKAGLFKDSKIVEVFPVLALDYDSETDGSSSIYFLSEENFNEVKDQLNLDGTTLRKLK